MRVMVLGSGGREHALAVRLRASPGVSEVLCAPGNGGTARVARNLPVNLEDPAQVVELARAERVDFVVVGPEGPLVLGVVDALSDAGILAFGPRRIPAQLEGSKSFCKRFMRRHAVPTAAFEVFDDAAAAKRFVQESGHAWVVKADGLAAGKGVIVAADVAETLDAIDRMLVRREFGEAGATLVLEERLRGQEVSYHIVLDGRRYRPLAAAQDHKRLADGDRGPNTGGMGAYSPPPVVTPEVERRILDQVVEPTVRGLLSDGLDFRGALFIGLMIDDGQPSVLEYNVRFGDPETEVLMARYGGDVLPLLLGAARGDLSQVEPHWDQPVALGIVVAAPGYPEAVKKNLPITGLDAAEQVPGVQVLHAGTSLAGDRLVSSGGRVLCVTATGTDIDEVAERAYRAVDSLHFEGMQFRRDIGHHARRGIGQDGAASGPVGKGGTASGS
jgi:phosphoribosylamine--glycine ligase